MQTQASLDDDTADRRARDLERRLAGHPADAVVAAVIGRAFPGRVALVSSFGAESAVLLHMAAAADPALPVIFLDTGKLFPEILDYRDNLADCLGLTDVRTVGPAGGDLARHDADGTLWARTPDRCCHLRKVLPLRRALTGFDAWFTGRKRHHGYERAGLALFEAQDGRVKVNPLALWRRGDVEEYLEAHDLPRHPLAAAGFASIGCVPCTAPAGTGESVRAGRWPGSAKTECGIHLASKPT